MSQAPPSTITIGDLARSCGTSLRAIRWYTEQGLLESCGMRGNCALYGPESRAQVRRIQVLQETGLTLAGIRGMFALIAADRTRNKQLTTTLRKVVRTQLETVREREAELARIRAALSELVAQTDRCDTCQARGEQHDCQGCGNLAALKTLGIADPTP